METVISDTNGMIDYGESLLQYGSKFLLRGELGAGKTTITKGIATGLGISSDNIQSPTYTYIHIYDEKLLHIDMRRIESEKQLLSLGLIDLMDQYEYIVIEWPKWEYNYSESSRQDISILLDTDGRKCIRKTIE